MAGKFASRFLHKEATSSIRDTYQNLMDAARKDEVVRRLTEGVLHGNRAVLAEAITLVESTNPVKQAKAQHLLTVVLEESKRKIADKGNSAFGIRIGVSGPPGAGKSTFLEALGNHLTAKGQKIACLTVDPSSKLTGGSLLGDKTRMPKLSCDLNAFIRPSPSSGVLGGVTRTTYESILLCESAGFDCVFVETVGSGQNEYVVTDMTDILILVISPAGGDELQGMKRGITELADLVVVNKSDGDLVPAARRTQAEYISALKFMPSRSSCWKPKVIRISSVTGEGIPTCWEAVTHFRQSSFDGGEFLKKRHDQNSRWMWRYIEDHLQELFRKNQRVSQKASTVEKAVSDGVISPLGGAQILINAFQSHS